MPQRALAVIRPVVRLSSRLAPRFTGRAAFHLFCTPLGHAPVTGKHPGLAAARAFFATAHLEQVTHGCGAVRVARFRPAGAARGRVLVLHGWASQALFMAGFAEKLVARGFEVLAVDLPGHGGSSGRKLNYPLAIEALAAVARQERDAFAGALGHSLGGAIALSAMAGGVPLFPRLGAERLVMVASPGAMRPYGKLFTRTLGLNERAHAAFEGEILSVAGRPMESFDSAAYLAGLSTPTLLLHAPDDKEAPFADAERMAAAGPHVRLQAVPGLGHRRILFDAAVQEAAADFIAAG